MTKQDQQFAFDEWWEKHGQFCRAGGGQYEVTFAYEAWMAAWAESLGEHPASLKEFKKDQWWVKELEGLVVDATPDQKRAVAVVKHLLDAIEKHIDPDLSYLEN